MNPGGQDSPWRILIVDDDADIHSVTKLVLKRKTWRSARFECVSAYNQAEASALLEKDPDFHVVLVDVVMERQDSGLELCRQIREICRRSTRIVLRTGQAGLMTEEQILNDYDIDYYLNKLEMTPSRLFSVVRACLRSSQDISTLLAYGRQLQSFTRALQYVSEVDNLVVFMSDALRFMEYKHGCTTTFNYDLSLGKNAVISGRPELTDALVHAHEQGLKRMQEYHGPQVGLDANDFVILFEAAEEGLREGDGYGAGPVLGGIVFTMHSPEITELARRELTADAQLFIENWCIAYSTIRLRDRLSQEQELRDQMYQDRLESIATTVTGVAHELNTPLGVARTAGDAAAEFAAELASGLGDPEEAETGMHEAIRLMNKNLDRAHRLIQSFRKLSASQLSDERVSASIKSTIDDCIETMSPELKRHRIEASVVMAADVDPVWDGYPGHLSQVIINLTQNALRYAYGPDEGGRIDIFVERDVQRDRFQIRFADYGRGVDESVRARLFDAFVTSGREIGGTGLGLAIVRNIVTNLLQGDITFESTPGAGTVFLLDLPATCGSDETVKGAAE
ncbi:ATP-binding protein [Actinocorallia lasiicapitis]